MRQRKTNVTFDHNVVESGSNFFILTTNLQKGKLTVAKEKREKERER